MADTVISTEIPKPVSAGRKTQPAGISHELRVPDAVAAGKDGEGRLTQTASALRPLLKTAGYTPGLTGARRNDAVMAFKSHVPYVCTPGGKHDDARPAKVCPVPNGAGKDIAIHHAVPQAAAAAVTAALPAVNRAIMAQTVLAEPKYCQKD